MTLVPQLCIKLIMKTAYGKKKFVIRFPINLTKDQKVKRVRISKGILKLFNDGRHRVFSKIIL